MQPQEAGDGTTGRNYWNHGMASIPTPHRRPLSCESMITQSRLDARYNRQREDNNIAGKIIVIGAILFLIAGAYVVWQYSQYQEKDKVTAEKVEYTRLQDNTLRLTFDSIRDNPELDSYCILLSWDYNHAELGRREVLIPAGGDKKTRHTVDIPSRGVPVLGEIYGCSTNIPSYLTEEPEELSSVPIDPTAHD